MENTIRKTLPEDLEGLKEVLNSSGLFPAEFLEDMIADYFNNSDSTDIWFTCSNHEEVLGFGYCAPEKLTEGTYNLYAIALKKEFQGKGIGQKMMGYIENLLREAGHRILIVDTSGSADFDLTRAFYLKCNYTKEATIREFWSEGEDKVVFWKKLQNT